MEEKLRVLYRKIAETVDEMIPEEWLEFHFYAQITDEGGETYFFYKSEENEEYYYSLDITAIYEVNEFDFEKNNDELFDTADKMRKIFKKEGQELWNSFTFSLTAEGKMKVNFDYTNWSNTSYNLGKQMKIWKYKYLGAEQEDEESKALIEKYLEEYPDNPI